MNLETIETKQKEIESNFSTNIRELNKTLIDNNLDTNIIYELTNMFYNYGYNERLRGVEQIKGIYKIK